MAIMAVPKPTLLVAKSTFAKSTFAKSTLLVAKPKPIAKSKTQIPLTLAQPRSLDEQVQVCVKEILELRIWYMDAEAKNDYGQIQIANIFDYLLKLERAEMKLAGYRRCRYDREMVWS